MPKRMVIAVPTFESILPDTFKSIYDLKIPRKENGEPNYILDFNFVRGYDCARARNTIVFNAIKDGYDYILMVDSDIVLPSDLLLIWDEERQKCEKDGIFLGGYLKKNNQDGLLELFNRNDADSFGKRNQYTTKDISELRKEGVTRFPVKAGGLGCAILNTEDLRRMEYPWFVYQIYTHGSVLSEDLWFCVHAAKHNIPVWSDTRVQCGHWFKWIQYE